MELAWKRWNSHILTVAHRVTLLHGLGGTGAIWRPIAANLENDFDVLALDQRGHGKSRTIPASEPRFTPEDFGRDIHQTLTGLQFYPTWLIGHSMGVRSACAAARLNPTGVQGLILVDLGLSRDTGRLISENLLEFISGLPEQFATRKEARAFLSAKCRDPSIAQYLMAVSEQDPSSGTVSFPFDRQALLKTIEQARDFSTFDAVWDLGASGMPILLLRGSQSLVWEQAEYAREKVQFSASPEHQTVAFDEIEGAGHGLPFEKRREFVEQVKRFIFKAARP
ncbi:alpha/beta hydrolase [Bdellovibrionota bacterium FG-2]